MFFTNFNLTFDQIKPFAMDEMIRPEMTSVIDNMLRQDVLAHREQEIASIFRALNLPRANENI